ncbi:MAG: 2-C-methyl-D-erythritol 4-phosphate cytidylyltransferase [Lachnospiraceae bacterium]|nr:2-C-methyl-D-erythritol 4-phosphate cytidylyltransferase [Lachnospiraceae bacterium]
MEHNTNIRVTAVVLAGGRGNRMKSDIPKQYLEIMDRPVLYYSLAAFAAHPAVDDIVLVTGAGEEDYCRQEIVDRFHIEKVKAVVAGGAERYDSVQNGLLAVEGLMKEAEASQGTLRQIVMIHDGARPCVTAEIIDRALSDVIRYGASVVAMPVKDTIKVADPEGFAASTPDRSLLWLIQTPQSFDYDLIRKAYDAFRADSSRGATDDAMLVERYTDRKVKLTPGDYRNIKITTPEDMILAEAFLKIQR